MKFVLTIEDDPIDGGASWEWTYNEAALDALAAQPNGTQVPMSILLKLAIADTIARFSIKPGEVTNLVQPTGGLNS